MLAGLALSQYSERAYTTEQGLPQNEVRSIAQTADGYLWFGTRDGLARFDGLHFTTFRKETTPGIGHNMFGAMLTDRAGRLWIATADGLSCYEHGKFWRYGTTDGLPSDAVHTMLEDSAGTLWVGTWQGLARFDGKRFTAAAIPKQAIAGLAEDGNGGLWVGTYGAGLTHLSGGRVRVFTERDGLPSNVIETLLRDRAGNLWIATLRGVVRLAAGDALEHAAFERVRELPGKSICLLEDRRGNIWASTDGGLARRGTEERSRFESEEGPQGASVETMFEDREGTLWVGTGASGALRYREGPFRTYTARDGLVSNQTQSMFEDSRRNLWIGTLNGLSRWSNGRMNTALATGNVAAIAEDANGRIWVGTEKETLRLEGGKWERMNGGVIPSDVHALLRDDIGRMWMGSPQGVSIWDRGHLIHLTARDGLPGDYVMALAAGRDGSIWIGTTNGLAQFAAGKIRAYTKNDGLLTNYVSSLYADADGALWICTPNGLHRLKDGKIDALRLSDGVTPAGALHVLEDDRKRLWISSSRGIIRVEKSELSDFAEGRRGSIEPVFYGTEDGMKTAICTGFGLQEAGCRTHDGKLWFPTELGVVTIDSASTPSALAPPEPAIEGVVVDGQATEERALNPGARRIEFDFTAPTSVAPERLEFRYRMAGFEDQWRSAGAERRISFTNLPAGDYRFDLAARRQGGAWSPAATASLQVLPHFYETRWFFALAALLLAGAVWLAHTLRVTQAEERMQAVMGERARLALELHDTMLQGMAGSAMEVQAGVRRVCQGAIETGVQQLQAALAHMEKSQADARQSIWDLKPAELEVRLDRGLRAACERICAGGPKLEFQVSGKPRALSAALERHSYRIGIEAVSNAARHSGAEQITVQLDYAPKSIRLTVRDNGCGFEQARATPAFSNHWGLSNMSERAAQCVGRVEIKSTPGEGTEISFEAPA